MKILATANLFLCLLPLAAAEEQQQKPEQQAPPPRALAGGIRQPPPPLPKVPDVRQPGETGYWIGFSAWFPTQAPTIDKGHASTFTTASETEFQGKPKFAENVEMGIAIRHNAVRISYFEDHASGNFTNANDLQLFTQTYTAGNYISTDYRIQTAKVSFDYLSWPYPVEDRKFRLRTLWGVQYTNVKSAFNLPLLPLVDASGNPIYDTTTGNPVNYATGGSKWFILPSIGIGLTQHVSRRLRLEANGSGFGIPHHANTWDADGSINLRAGRWELRVGAKAFHFKTSAQGDFFFRGTQASGFVGIRWYSE